LRYHDSVKETLVQYGYLKNKDYYYFDDCIMQQKDGYYEDNHGNKVVGKYSGKGIFYFGGCHSSVEIGDNVRLNKTQIDVGHHSVLSIGDASNLNDVTIKMGNGAECFIGNATTMFRVSMDIRANSYWHSGIRCMFTCDFGFGKHSILVRYGGRCTIGNNCLLLDGLVMTLDGGTIDIGNDCMFSHDVVLRSTDAHSLFDVLSGENINSTPDICKARRIEIGNHVWIGARSFILYNTVLRDGAVIGAQSLVKGYVPNNAIAAGSPARVIRENIAWCRKFGSGNISDCGEEYVNLTITEE
jgi:acetyltransferase-like isoleucine patch superfamily enzyme